MIESTNTMLKVVTNTETNFGYFVFALAAGYIVYALITNRFLRQKKEKLTYIIRLIEEGHERRVRNEEKE